MKQDMEDEKKDEDDDRPKISKRKQKQMTRLSVAELKPCVSRPDVVCWTACPAESNQKHSSSTAPLVRQTQISTG